MDLHGDDRTALAPAKLNLFLDVLSQRSDGFHNLETLMVPIRLADQITFTPSFLASDDIPGDIRLDIHVCWPRGSPLSSQTVPPGSENLIVRSLELLRKRSGSVFGAHVELVKRIPMAAGLGGASSDAAAALRLANRGWRINWSLERLAKLAAELGSDVPFFLSHGAAICRGRGEQIESLPPLAPVHFVVVKPAESLSTGDVYRAYDSSSGGTRTAAAAGQLNRLVEDLYIGGRRSIGRWMQNRLQEAASVLLPAVHTLRQAFAELDFVGHQLTGSGSAYFGVCRHAQHARRLASILRSRQLGLVYATRSCQ